LRFPDRPLEIAHLLFDVNGTLTDRGLLIDGVGERLARLREDVAIQLLSADTFGTLAETRAILGAEARLIHDGEDKRRLVAELSPSRCAAIGNGLNDPAMLEAAALAIAVVGPEGGSGRALLAGFTPNLQSVRRPRYEDMRTRSGTCSGACSPSAPSTPSPAVTTAWRAPRTRHATWLAALFVIAFLTPYVLADTLEIQRDVYYALYGGIAITFAWAWGRATEQSWGQMIARRWRLTLLLVALGGAALIPAAIADTVAPPVDM
jgi:soluble P-type ATPase/drug/metabolite transporter superfamily protein YnfA